MSFSADEIARIEASRPRPYDLYKPEECARLLRETLGYAHVSLLKKEGTDLLGREFAVDALKHAMMLGYRLVPPGTIKGTEP